MCPVSGVRILVNSLTSLYVRDPIVDTTGRIGMFSCRIFGHSGGGGGGKLSIVDICGVSFVWTFLSVRHSVPAWIIECAGT